MRERLADATRQLTEARSALNLKEQRLTTATRYDRARCSGDLFRLLAMKDKGLKDARELAVASTEREIAQGVREATETIQVYPSTPLSQRIAGEAARVPS
jgi:hypothetical protein